MRLILRLILIAMLSISFSACNSYQKMAKKAQADKTPKIALGLQGNSYVTDTLPQTRMRWQRNMQAQEFSRNMIPGRKLSVYFKANTTGLINVFLDIEATDVSQLKVSILDRNQKLNLIKNREKLFAISYYVKEPGYQQIDIERIDTNEQSEVKLFDVLVNGDAADKEKLNYVHDFSTHFGRRGPSVHLNYVLPKETIEYFYNEVTVTEGNDVVGSYFMANGFGEGYFGMQVNSTRERRILFSVWSPFETDRPNEIPEDQKVRYLRRGENVKGSEFGGEGSGGQSYMVYPWKVGVTYSFLTQIHPDGEGNSIYTAYFYDPEIDKWMLMASFSRPKTNTYYTRAHSFLENFNEETGWVTRRGHFGNQWVRTLDGRWLEITQTRFSHDATASAGMRLDYKGGVEDGKFFMQNCGFFDDNTKRNTVLNRAPIGKAPDIDLEALKKIASVDK